jgi:hypothetical protein
MTQNEAYRLIGLLFTSYPSAKLTQQHADSYASAIMEMPVEGASKAIERLRRTSKFLPSISEVRECVSDLTVGPRRTGVEAWETLQKALRKWGWCNPPKITDPKMARAIDVLGGWQAACSITTDMEMSARARFIEAYDVFARRERLDMESGIPLPAQMNAEIGAPRKAMK